MADENAPAISEICRRIADVAGQQATVMQTVSNALSALTAGSASVQSRLDLFDQFSQTQMKATVDVFGRIDAMAAQLAAMQQDIALIKESLVALSSARH